jgi:hydrogenase maturation protein HypF
MLLEGLAARHGPVAPLAEGWTIGADGTLDLLPLAAAMLEISGPARGAALFHATLIEALADWILRASLEQDLANVVFGGGCFVNEILARGLRARLLAAGLEVFEAVQAPANDGGIALGQSWVAQRAATLGAR